jgi:hypothetical protein
MTSSSIANNVYSKAMYTTILSCGRNLAVFKRGGVFYEWFSSVEQICKRMYICTLAHVRCHGNATTSHVRSSCESIVWRLYSVQWHEKHFTTLDMVIMSAVYIALGTLKCVCSYWCHPFSLQNDHMWRHWISTCNGEYTSIPVSTWMGDRLWNLYAVIVPLSSSNWDCGWRGKW